MANFKKIAAGAAALAMMGSLAACGSNTAVVISGGGYWSYHAGRRLRSAGDLLSLHQFCKE